MKVKIDRDEWYPVYSVHSVHDQYGDEIEVDDLTAERWRRVTAEFESIQDEMDEAWRKATP